MPVPTLEDAPFRALDPDSPIEERIEERMARLEQRVERGNREGRQAGKAFMIFAVGSLILGMVILVAITAKLDGTSKPAAVAKTAASAAPAAPAAAARNIAVSLKEFTVAPSAAVGHAGRVSFAVRNSGTVPHEFVVIRTDKAAGSLPFKAGRADEAGNVGETGDLEPGKAKTIGLSLKPGHYALICNLPGHYKAGQHADFRVVG
jgi:uncharacterized cupredoxin-like copper-binding protein